MKKNVTLSADEELLRKARLKAARHNSTINREFRAWLRQYIRSEETGSGYDKLMEEMAYANAGRKFTRDEMNER